MPREYEGYTTKDERKAIKDAETVEANAPDEATKSQATSTLTAAHKAAPNVKPPVKSYDIESLKKNPLESKDDKITKQNTDAFNKLSAEEKKKFVIKAKLAENMHLDKKDQHELSKEDLVLAGVMTATTPA